MGLDVSRDWPSQPSILFTDRTVYDDICCFHDESPEDNRCTAPAVYLLRWSPAAQGGGSLCCAMHAAWARSADNAHLITKIETFVPRRHQHRHQHIDPVAIVREAVAQAEKETSDG